MNEKYLVVNLLLFLVTINHNYYNVQVQFISIYNYIIYKLLCIFKAYHANPECIYISNLFFNYLDHYYLLSSFQQFLLSTKRVL